MKKFLKCAFLFFCLLSKIYAQDFVKLKYVPTNLEIEVLNVSVSIVATDDDFASYYAKLPDGKKLSCVENRGTFRVRSVYRTSGEITIKVPKNKILERMRITAALGNIYVQDLSVVHATILLTRGDIEVSNCTFKTSNLTQNTGNLKFSAGVKSSAICVSNVTAAVSYLGKLDDYHLDYAQANSRLVINETLQEKLQGQLGRENALKRALLSASASVVTVQFPASP